MKIAVINEVSASIRNSDIVRAIEQTAGAEILNVGMKNPEEQPQLTYIHTSYMAALLLNAGACDFVVGGCGTGQGFLNAVLQYPGVTCGLIIDPLDAWLFTQINAGNCISLPLNKGYGWAADVNLKYVFEKMFSDPHGQGYPMQRAESQASSRAKLAEISKMTHHSMIEIISNTDKEILHTIAKNKVFMEVLESSSVTGSEMAKMLYNL